MFKFIFPLLLFQLFPLFGAIPPETLRRRMLSDLEHINNVFEVKYAPAVWKQDKMEWNQAAEYKRARNAILEMETPNLKEFHQILKNYFNAVKDYHVGVSFYSTEEAHLPFIVKGVDGRYFVRHSRASPLQVGDEILSFDGEPTHNVIERLRKEEFGDNNPKTDQALAELLLTSRSGKRGQIIPEGKCVLKVKKKRAGKIVTLNYEWTREREWIKEPATGALEVACNPLTASFKSDQSHLSLLSRKMVGPTVGKKETPYTLGGRESYLPTLGDVIFKNDDFSFFKTYIFQNGEKKIGVLRIPHYLCGQEDLEEFEELISHLEKETDALIIDQLNNSGGSVFALYTMLSFLTDRTLIPPKHHIAITQQEVYLAADTLDYLETIEDDFAASELLGDTFEGYPVNYRMVENIREFCHFIISEWEMGHLFTDLTHIFGIVDIEPHPRGHYSKPILILTNALDFSGGDFFPAIMQDNGRAKILGAQTAGAGGYVLTNSFPNFTGIARFFITGSFAKRVDEKSPIENLGVSPDILYEPTVADLQGNFEEYRATILKELEKLL